MLSFNLRRLSALCAAALLTGAVALPATAAGPVTVQVNGNTVNLSPAPTERAGRVFVPLRGVFENLGASVVYAAGVINATGRGHNIQLHIGQTAATVDGQQQNLDVAPFIIGASTYVPLRFVSQALGATVNYDGSHNLVAISTNGNTTAAAPANQTLTPAANANQSALRLTNEIPSRGATVSSRRPQIEAQFAGTTADPNSLKVYIDQVDVTNDATRAPNGIAYASRSPLIAGRHTVRVTGRDAAGASFDRSWAFISGSSAAVNAITNVTPGSGATVPNSFVITGHTAPNSRVSVSVTASGNSAGSVGQIVGSLFGINTGSSNGNAASYDLTADANGNFTTQVNIGAGSGSQLLVVINATEPINGAAAPTFRENLTVR